MAVSSLSTWVVILIGCLLCVLLSAIFGVVLFLLWRCKQKKKLTNSISFQDSNHNNVNVREGARKRERPTISVCTPGRVGAILHVVRYAFKPYRHNHLSLTIGQIVQVLGDSFIGDNGEDWFLGTIDDKLEGIFPCEVVVKMSLSATKRSQTPTRDLNPYETNQYDVIEDSNIDTREKYNQFINTPLTEDNVAGIVNEIFSISDESHIREVEGVIYGNVGEARQASLHHRLSLNLAAASAASSAVGGATGTLERHPDDPIGHSSLDVDIPTRNEMGVYDADSVKESANCYENVASIKNGTYVDTGENLDVVILPPIDDVPELPVSDVVLTIPITADGYLLHNGNHPTDVPGDNNTYDVIVDDDIDHYDEIFIDDPHETNNEQKWYVAVKTFTPSYVGQLALRPGDQLVIQGSEVTDVSVDDGETWMTGESLTTGKQGSFPRRCVVAMTDKIDSRSSKRSSKYSDNQNQHQHVTAATSSYETIYDHRDPLVVAHGLEDRLTPLPDLVNNPNTDLARGKDQSHIYGNVKMIQDVTIDSSDDYYLIPLKGEAPSITESHSPNHSRLDVDLTPAIVYDQLPRYGDPNRGSAVSNRYTVSPTNSASSTSMRATPPKKPACLSNPTTPTNLPNQHSTPTYHRPTSLSNSVIPTQRSIMNRRHSYNIPARLDLSVNTTMGEAVDAAPLYDTPQPKPAVPIKPKRNSMILSISDLSLKHETPPTAERVVNNAFVSRSSLSSTNSSPFSATTTTSNNRTVATTVAAAPLSLSNGMPAITHVSSPRTSAYGVPAFPVAPSSPLHSDDVSIATSGSKISASSSAASLKLFTATGYAKPRLQPKSGDEILSRAESLSTTRTTTSSPSSADAAPVDTPNFYKRVAGVVRPLKFAPIRFSPKTTPTQEQSFDFIDTSFMQASPPLQPVLVVPDFRGHNGYVTSTVTSIDPPALPTSPPPDF